MSCAWAVGGQLLPPTQSGTRAYHERAPNGKFGVILSPYASRGSTSTRFITSPKVVPRRSPRRAHLGRRTARYLTTSKLRRPDQAAAMNIITFPSAIFSEGRDATVDQQALAAAAAGTEAHGSALDPPGGKSATPESDDSSSEGDDEPEPAPMSTGFKLNLGKVAANQVDGAKPVAVPHTPKGELVQGLLAKQRSFNAAVSTARPHAKRAASVATVRPGRYHRLPRGATLASGGPPGAVQSYVPPFQRLGCGPGRDRMFPTPTTRRLVRRWAVWVRCSGYPAGAVVAAASTLWTTAVAGATTTTSLRRCRLASS